MSKSTLTIKGQTTIPIEIRQALGLKPRQRIEWAALADGTAILRPAKAVSGLAGSLRSRVRFPGLKKERAAQVKAWAREEARR